MKFDITDALEAENELVIRAEDDLRSHVLPYGKQVLNRGNSIMTVTVWAWSYSKTWSITVTTLICAIPCCPP